jgi:polyhydroxyalkanoate synthesis regulator protein
MARRKPASPRLIKRYARSRLYDPVTSRYVSLDDLRRWGMEGVKLTVRDVETGQDVTQEVVSLETAH